MPATRSSPAQEPTPQRRAGRLGALPVLAHRQITALTRAEGAVGVRVATSTCVAFGGDQHMIGQRQQVAPAERTAVGGGLAIVRSSHGPPVSRRELGHLPILTEAIARTERRWGKLSRIGQLAPPRTPLLFRRRRARLRASRGRFSRWRARAARSPRGAGRLRRPRRRGDRAARARRASLRICGPRRARRHAS
jgi:hypothetical protein